MSKEHKREPITPFKPQPPPIYSCDQGRICEEVKDLRNRLEMQRLDTKLYKRLYHAALVGTNNSLQKANEARRLLIESKEILSAAHKALNFYRRAFNVMRIINIIFTAGFAIMTAILIWR